MNKKKRILEKLKITSIQYNEYIILKQCIDALKISLKRAIYAVK